MGKLPQLKEVKHNCNVWDDPNFIDRFPFQKIDISPILSHAILHNRTKKSDLVEVGGIGFSYGSIIISNKLKQIIENSNHFGVQFFQTKLYHKNVQDISYWQTHIYDFPYDYIDFEETKVIVKGQDENRQIIKEELKISNLKEFLSVAKFIKYPKTILLENLNFNKEMNLDYFKIKYVEDSINGIISERLKEEIERQGCTGIEFKPLEISLADWLQGGERERIYGKSY